MPLLWEYRWNFLMIYCAIELIISVRNINWWASAHAHTTLILNWNRNSHNLKPIKTTCTVCANMQLTNIWKSACFYRHSHTPSNIFFVLIVFVFAQYAVCTLLSSLCTIHCTELVAYEPFRNFNWFLHSIDALFFTGVYGGQVFYYFDS